MTSEGGISIFRKPLSVPFCTQSTTMLLSSLAWVDAMVVSVMAHSPILDKVRIGMPTGYIQVEDGVHYSLWIKRGVSVLTTSLEWVTEYSLARLTTPNVPVTCGR